MSVQSSGEPSRSAGFRALTPGCFNWDRRLRSTAGCPPPISPASHIDAVLVTELSRWGRSTLDLLETLRELETRRVSLVALSGMTFDLASATGRMMATMLAGISEFERDLLRERVRSGLAAAKARGKLLGRQPGQRPNPIAWPPRSSPWSTPAGAIG